LRPFAGGQHELQVEAGTVGEAIHALTGAHPELHKHLFTPEGKLRAFVNLYLNEDDIRYLPDKENTRVSAADSLSIIPSIAGGTGRRGGRALGGMQIDMRIQRRNRNLVSN
jgi:molybdopterin converting factor small subunit